VEVIASCGSVAETYVEMDPVRNAESFARLCRIRQEMDDGRQSKLVDIGALDVILGVVGVAELASSCPSFWRVGLWVYVTVAVLGISGAHEQRLDHLARIGVVEGTGLRVESRGDLPFPS